MFLINLKYNRQLSKPFGLAIALTMPQRCQLVWHPVSTYSSVWITLGKVLCVCVHLVAMVPAGEFDTTSAAYSASLLMKSLQWKVSSYGCP